VRGKHINKINKEVNTPKYKLKEEEQQQQIEEINKTNQITRYTCINNSA